RFDGMDLITYSIKVLFKKSVKRDCLQKKDDGEVEQSAIQIEKLARNDTEIFEQEALNEFIAKDSYSFRSLFKKYQERLYNDVLTVKKCWKQLKLKAASEMSKYKQRADDNIQAENVLDVQASAQHKEMK
ncbi:hypothetical protein RFI_37134, partial [Reticulomyxa filosa]